jgi:hypothetical protein
MKIQMERELKEKQLDFEREKWLAEMKLRKHELGIEDAD